MIVLVVMQNIRRESPNWIEEEIVGLIKSVKVIQ